MAHLRCDVFSETLALSTSMTVVLPQPTTAQVGMTGLATSDPPPVLYLLHGLSDDDTTWVRRTSVERYAASLGLAVVMPAVQRSFYTDEAMGLRYWAFLSEELPELVGRFFRVSQAREDTFVAGLSMGGYGAMKWGLRRPERFAAVASLSGVLDAGFVVAHDRADDPHLTDRVFGRNGPAAQDDPARLLEVADPATLPAIWVGCGTADRLFAQNERFVARCRARGIPVTTSMVDGADHTWDLWDREIERVLGWLPIRRT
jgi:putative tributyrin esterase